MIRWPIGVFASIDAGLGNKPGGIDFDVLNSAYYQEILHPCLAGHGNRRRYHQLFRFRTLAYEGLWLRARHHLEGRWRWFSYHRLSLGREHAAAGH